MGQGRFDHDRILSGVIMCHVVGNNGVFPERGSRGPCVGFWGPGSIWQRMWYFCAKFLWIKGVFYHGLCVIIYAGRIVPCLHWYLIRVIDQLCLLQLPQPGTHQHRPHTEDAVTPKNFLHQGDRPASQGSTLTVVRLGIPSSFCCRTTWTYVYGCPIVKLRKLIK